MFREPLETEEAKNGVGAPPCAIGSALWECILFVLATVSVWCPCAGSLQPVHAAVVLAVWEAVLYPSLRPKKDFFVLKVEVSSLSLVDDLSRL